MVIHWRQQHNMQLSVLGRSTAAGRWARLGPYYAMFPLEFVFSIINQFTQPGHAVIDPFCGRGTVPIMAKITGRFSAGIDINPVAFVYSAAKTDPEPNPATVIERINEIADLITRHDCLPENEFQRWAWSPHTLGFLRVARRVLDWRNNRRDRTLMAIILVHLHGKLGTALSNQMRQTKSMAPNYSVRWWKSRNMEPPDIDARSYLIKKIQWRYKYGIVWGPDSEIRYGDARAELNNLSINNFALLLTSPPYYNVTNYRLDHWMRIWLLGGPSLPEGDTRERYGDKTRYKALLYEVFRATKPLLTDDAMIYVRTDSRKFTLNTTLSVLNSLWPERSVYWRAEKNILSQTRLFGDNEPKPGETDILLPPERLAVSRLLDGRMWDEVFCPLDLDNATTLV